MAQFRITGACAWLVYATFYMAEHSKFYCWKEELAMKANVVKIILVTLNYSIKTVISYADVLFTHYNIHNNL